MKKGIASVVLVLASSDCLRSQFLWVLQPTPVHPVARWHGALAYDAQRQHTLLFGGRNGAAMLDDTWTWDGGAWTQVVTSMAPPARQGHTLVYDALRDRVVLFGGYSLQLGVLGDTWEWDGSVWTERSPASSPASRHVHAAAYDTARGRVVVFGGQLANASHASDTWEWDGVSWVQRATLSSPSQRAGHAMAYDLQRGRTVLFGGYSSGAWFDDTWEWDGLAWTLCLPSVRPTARADHAMAFDDRRGRSVLLGGYSGAQGILGDTWEWDGASWSAVTPAVGPQARRWHRLSFDIARDRVLLFGGDAQNALGDTWLSWHTPASAVAYGSGCGGPVPAFTPAPGSLPLIGQSQVCDVSNAYLGIAFVAWGQSRAHWAGIPLPVALDPFGFTGCLLWQSADVDLAMPCATVGFTAARHTLPIPSSSHLHGATAYLQAWTFQPNANPVGIVLSNAIELTVSSF